MSIKVIQSTLPVKSEIAKVEQLIQDADQKDYRIPEHMNIHRFIEGLQSKDIKERLYAETFATMEEYFERAIILEQSSPGNRLGSKRPANQPQYNKEPRYEKNRKKDFRCFECNQVGHRASDCPSKQKSNLNSMRCYGCNQQGHKISDCPKRSDRGPPYRKRNRGQNHKKSNFNAMMKEMGDLFDITGEEDTLEEKPMLSYAYAKIRGKIVKVLIDSGASFNCISVKLANDLGIKELRPIKNPPKIVLPDGSKIVAIGSVSMGVGFTRHLEEVKFLVINDLSQDCILGQDGQTQFEVRLDWK